MFLATWYGASAKSDANRAQSTLDQVDAAMRGWQQQIMQSTVGILDSMPQVIKGKAALAKVESAKMLADGIQKAIHDIVGNPHPSATGHTQQENLKTLGEQLNTLLASMTTEDGD